MYPNLSDLILDVFGIYIPMPVRTFGFFMAMGFLAGTFYLIREFKRQEKLGFLKGYPKKVLVGAPTDIKEIIVGAIVSFIIWYKLGDIALNYGQVVANPESFVLSLRGNFITGILGMIITTAYRVYTSRKNTLEKPYMKDTEVMPHEHVTDIIAVAAITGVSGSKLLSVLEDWQNFIADPIGMFFSFSGLTFYGGLIGGAIGVWWYARRLNLPIRRLMDAAGPAVMIGYAVGRLGCHFSGDGDWGIANEMMRPGLLAWLPDWAWAYDYPNNVLGRGIPIPGCEGEFCARLEKPVWPTSVYEFVLGSGIFAFLVRLRHKLAIPGMLFGVYFILNGVERFLIEFVRVNERYAFNMSLSQFIALGLVIIGGLMIWWFRRNPDPYGDLVLNEKGK